MMNNLSHEQMMEKSWNLIREFGITDNRDEFNIDPANHFLVENIYQVRDAYYQDLENNIEVKEEDICGFLDRHGIKWE